MRSLTILFSLLALFACAESEQEKPLDQQLAEFRALQDAGRGAETVQPLIELIESGQRDGELFFLYARARSTEGNPMRGIWALEEAMSYPEWLVRAAHRLALLYYRAGNYDQAIQTLDRLRNERQGPHEKDLPALLLEARANLQSRRHYEEALEVIDTIFENYPAEDEAYRLKAVALLGLKRPDEAYEVIRAAGSTAADALLEGGDRVDGESQDPTDPEALAEVDLLDTGEASTGDEEAGDELEIELGADSRDAYWCSVRATFKRESGEIEEAVEVVEACLEKSPAAEELIQEAVKLYTSLRRPERIMQILLRGNEENPKSHNIRMSLVRYYTDLGRTAEAEDLLRGAIDYAIEDNAEPVAVASLWVDLGAYQVDRKKTAAALESFAEATAILGDRSPPTLLFRHAEAMIMEGEYDAALAIANRTPIEVHQPMLRGRVAFERGDYAEAIRELDQAAILWPDNAAIRYYLARAAEASGDFDRAIEEYRQAIRSDPSMSAPRERLTKLHLAEGRVRHAKSILEFVSPAKQSGKAASTPLSLLIVEVQARLGVEPDLNIPPSADYPLPRLRLEAVRSLSRGVRRSSDTQTTIDMLGKLEEMTMGDPKGAFIRERVALLIELGELEDAYAYARAALDARPGDQDMALSVARTLIALNRDLDEAEKMLRGVLVVREQDSDAIVGLGDLAALRGDAAGAAALYEEALEVDPEHWRAISRRMDGLDAAGRSAEATARLETYLGHDAPYDGRAALVLAKRLEEQDAPLERRVALARQAVRFGAGPEAIELLGRLDPQAAAALRAAAPPSQTSGGEDAGQDETPSAARIEQG